MRIRWTPPAADDLTRISDYIEEHDSPATARRVALAIYQAIGTLERFPRRGRPGRCAGTRELVIVIRWEFLYRMVPRRAGGLLLRKSRALSLARRLRPRLKPS